jgi:hypothetical protein
MQYLETAKIREMLLQNISDEAKVIFKEYCEAVEHSHQEFLELVAQMRSAQRDYFRTRDYNALNLSKKLEWKIDALLKK